MIPGPFVNGGIVWPHTFQAPPPMPVLNGRPAINVGISLLAFAGTDHFVYSDYPGETIDSQRDVKSAR